MGAVVFCSVFFVALVFVTVVMELLFLFKD